MSLIGLLIWILVFGLICYLIFWAMKFLGFPEPIQKVVTVIVVIIAVLYLVGYLLPGANLHLIPIR